MTTSVADHHAELGFSKVADEPYTLRCYTRQALLDSLSDGISLYSRTTADRGSSENQVTGAQYNILRNTDFPFWGKQEIRFFEPDLGLIVSDFTIEEAFNYEFIYENLSFIQFRIDGSSMEQLSPGAAPIIINRPSFKLSMAPAGHVDIIHYPPASRWRTVTAFFDAAAIRRLLDSDTATTDALSMLNGWKARFQSAPQPLSPGMLDALRSIMGCPYTGALRRAFLEAKTRELLCLTLALTADQPLSADNIPLRFQDKARLGMARDILDLHFAHPPTLTELGRMVGLNRRKLAIGFKQIFGQTVFQYCLERRMARARALLAEGRAIAHAAEATGYADQASFSRAFRQFHGQPPGYFLAH